MATGTDRSTRQRLRLAVAALGVWVVVVVVGAGRTADDALLGVENLDDLWLIVVGLGAVLGLVLLVLLNPFGNEWTRPEKQRRGGMWALLLLALALLVWRPDLVEQLGEEAPAQAAGRIAPLDIAAEGEVPEVETVAQATDLLALAAVAGLAAGGWFLLRARRRPAAAEPHPAGELEAELLAAIDAVTEELVVDGDPRAAVLRSYAILESVLAEHGAARLAHETPTEHLRRALGDRRIEAAPFLHLGGLYEIARFSEREIGRSEQQQAADALSAARTGLVGAR